MGQKIHRIPICREAFSIYLVLQFLWSEFCSFPHIGFVYIFRFINKYLILFVANIFCVVLLILTSNYSLLVNWKKLTFIYSPSWNCVITNYYLQKLFCWFLGIFYIGDQVIANRDSFISVFLTCMPFILLH